MILLDLLSIALAAVALYQLQDLRKQHNARLTTLERREPEKRVQAPQDWNKPIEGFNPKKPSTVLPRSEEERNARVKTVREVDQNVFEFDSKL